MPLFKKPPKEEVLGKKEVYESDSLYVAVNALFWLYVFFLTVGIVGAFISLIYPFMALNAFFTVATGILCYFLYTTINIEIKLEYVVKKTMSGNM